MLDIRKTGINYHNFLLDTKPRTWFKRVRGESIEDWLGRTAYQGENGFINRKVNEDSFKISIVVLSFLRENFMKKETLEDLLGFELNFSATYDYKISEIRRLELILNKKII